MDSSVYHSLSCLNEQALEGHIKILLDAPLDEKEFTFDLSLKEGASFKLTIVDLQKNPFSLHLSLHLPQNSSCDIALASLHTELGEKVFDVALIHDQSDSYSRTKMAGINANSGSLKFLGSSIIRPGAKRSDTRQEGKITNLSEKAKSECSPALVIKENDVKASHGASLGAYNPDHLFYLMSRGLSMEQSKKLITYGTLLPILERLEDEELLNKAKDALGALTL